MPPDTSRLGLYPRGTTSPRSPSCIQTPSDQLSQLRVSAGVEDRAAPSQTMFDNSLEKTAHFGHSARKNRYNLHGAHHVCRFVHAVSEHCDEALDEFIRIALPHLQESSACTQVLRPPMNIISRPPPRGGKPFNSLPSIGDIVLREFDLNAGPGRFNKRGDFPTTQALRPLPFYPHSRPLLRSPLSVRIPLRHLDTCS